jgi:integrase/recombinase XerD
LADAAAEFADWLTAQGRAANTVAAYRRDVAAYLRWLNNTGAGDNALAAYVEHVRSTRKPSSAARAVVALRIFHRWRDVAPMPELAGVPVRKEPALDEDALDEDAIATLLRACAGESVERRRDAIGVGLSYFGGLKATESISLDVNDVSRDHSVLTVDRDGPHERLLPVVPALQEALERWLDPRGRTRLQPASGAVLLNRRGQRLTRQGLWLLTGAAGKRAGLDSVLSPNDLRRACGAHLLRRGLTQSQVGAFLGTSRGGVPTSGNLNEVGWGSCTLAP